SRSDGRLSSRAETCFRTPDHSRMMTMLFRSIRGRFPAWLLLGAVLLPCLYLPTLATRFDFIDDGNLVYPSEPMPPGQRLAVVWRKIVANYEDLGPFRPVLWLHWEAEAELFGADAFDWRLGRLAWMVLATGALLWLLRELG